MPAKVEGAVAAGNGGRGAAGNGRPAVEEAEEEVLVEPPTLEDLVAALPEVMVEDTGPLSLWGMVEDIGALPLLLLEATEEDMGALALGATVEDTEAQFPGGMAATVVATVAPVGAMEVVYQEGVQCWFKWGFSAIR